MEVNIQYIECLCICIFRIRQILPHKRTCARVYCKWLLPVFLQNEGSQSYGEDCISWIYQIHPENMKITRLKDFGILNVFSRWWQLKYLLFSPRTLGFHDPNWRSHIFQMGWLKPLVQPPTIVIVWELSVYDCLNYWKLLIVSGQWYLTCQVKPCLGDTTRWETRPLKSLTKKSDGNLQQVGCVCDFFKFVSCLFLRVFCVIYIYIDIFIYLYIYILYNIKIDFGTFQETNKQRSFFHVTTIVVTTW